jgi:hypothetical protein
MAVDWTVTNINLTERTENVEYSYKVRNTPKSYLLAKVNRDSSDSVIITIKTKMHQIPGDTESEIIGNFGVRDSANFQITSQKMEHIFISDTNNDGVLIPLEHFGAVEEIIVQIEATGVVKDASITLRYYLDSNN